MTDYRLSDLLDMSLVQRLADSHYKASGLPMSVIEACDSTIVVKAGWGEICRSFHRANPESNQRCYESDSSVKDQLSDGESRLYRCKNGMWHNATPIIVAGKHLGTMFLSQFFFSDEVIDRDLFVRQAEQFGFDKKAYLEALDSAPVFSRDQVKYILGYHKSLARFIGDLAEQSLKVIETQKALRESESKYRNIFENALEGMFQSTFEGRFTNVNPAMATILGYDSPEELIASITNLNRHLYVNPDDRIALLSTLTAQGRVNGFETQFFRKDGTVRWISISARLLRAPDGTPALIEGLNTDITDSKLAHQRIQESEHKYRSLVENVKIGVYRSTGGCNGRFTQANSAMLQIFGYDSLAEFLEITVDSCYRDLQDRIRFFSDLRQYGYVKDCELVMLRKDGTPIWCALTATANYDEQGEIAWVDGVLEDISERKHAEADKLRLEAQLNQSQKMEAIGQLAGGIAHDFNNILTAIIGYGNLMKQKIGSNDTKLLRYAEQILFVSDKAVNLTKGLLAFSRKQVMEPKPQKINAIIKGLEKIMTMLLREDIAFKLQLSADDPTVMADLTQVDQILINLATNARDAMPHGGKLTIETRLAEFDDAFIHAHGFGTPGTYVSIDISDTGIGMDSDTQAKIFEPFFTTKEVGKGTGLGLAIVYGIVRQHDGFINVYSEAGQGTTFHIYLPVIAAAVGEDTVPHLEAECGTETILVAEDNTESRNLIHEVLTSKGYTVIEAVDGEDAISLFRINQDRISFLVFDVVMPRKNGVEAYEEIKQLAPGIKVLFMSGYTGDIILTKGLHENEFNFISKPLSPNQLLYKIREVLDS